MGRGTAFSTMGGWESGASRVLPAGFTRRFRRAHRWARARLALKFVLSALFARPSLALIVGGLLTVSYFVLPLPAFGGLALALWGGVSFATLRCYRADTTWLRALSLLDGATGNPGDPLRTLVSAAIRFRGESSAATTVVEPEPLLLFSVARLFQSEPSLHPKKAVPLEPRHLFAFGLALGGTLALLVLRVVPAREFEQKQAEAPRLRRDADQTQARKALQAAERRLLAEGLWDGRPESSPLAAAAQELNRAHPDRDQAVLELTRTLQALEARETERMRLASELAKRGAVFQEFSVTRSLGEAMAQGDVAGIAEALKKLEERMSEDAGGLSERELRELRQAMEALRDEREKAEAKAEAEFEKSRKLLNDRRQELNKKAKSPEGLSEDEKGALAETERKLEELDRRRKEKAPPKELSDLDRELADLARELKKARSAQEAKNQARQFLERARDKAKRLTTDSMTEDQKKRLIEQLRRLKKELTEGERKEGESEEAFEKRAQGRSGGPGDGASSGSDVSIEVSSQPSGSPGSSSSNESGSKPGSAEGESEASAAASRPSGDGIGSSHSPEDLFGDASKASGRADDAFAAGKDTGKGESSSETIAAAAEKGFTRRSYRSLFREYESVMEESMGEEKIPPGRRKQVTRYFDLIRPRNAPKGQ